MWSRRMHHTTNVVHRIIAITSIDDRLKHLQLVRLNARFVESSVVVDTTHDDRDNFRSTLGRHPITRRGHHRDDRSNRVDRSAGR